MVKVSLKGKTPEVKHDQSISYINSGQTPGKGILKKTEIAPKSEGRQGRQTHKVNFNDTVDMAELPAEELDETEENKRSLSESLALIDSLNFDRDDEETGVNKKLEFDDDDDVFEDNVPVNEPEEPEGAVQGDHEIPRIEISYSSPPVDMSSSERCDSPMNRRSILPAVKVTLATPAPRSRRSSAVEKLEKTASPKLRVPRRSTGTVKLETTDSPLKPLSNVPRRSTGTDKVEKTDSPLKPQKKVRNRRVEEVRTEAILTIDITTPEEKPRRSRGDAAVSSPRTPKTPDTPVKSGSTPKTPKRGKKKSSVGSQDDKDDEDKTSDRVSSIKQRKSLNRSLSEDVTSSPNNRQLRNRSAIAASNVTFRKRRTSAGKFVDHLVGKEVHESDVGNKENSGKVEPKFQSPKTPRGFSKVDSPSLRRSARKSVRFVPEEDCSACKPVPLTPRSLKARISFFGDPELGSQPLPSGDLMAFDSPKTRKYFRHDFGVRHMSNVAIYVRRYSR